MSRSYSTFRDMQPFADGSKKATYSAMTPSDHVHRPVTADAQVRQMPTIRYASGSNGETYVIKAEKIVEHSIVPAPVSSFLVEGYRYSSQQPGKEEHFGDYGVQNWSTPLGSTYHRPEQVEYTHLDSPFDRPQEVEEFITKVMTEASRGPTGPVALPLSSAWHSGPNRNVQQNTRKYGDERDFRGDDRKKLNARPNWDRQNEPYLNNRGANTHPMIGNNRDVYDFDERPRGDEDPNARNHPLSKPTNDIGTAMEFLKESIKPSYGNGKEKEFNASAYPEASQPTKTVPLASRGRRTGLNMWGPETKMESKDYESEEEEEESRNPRHGKRDELKTVNNRGGAKPFENKDGYEKPKGNAAAKEFNATAYPEASRPTKTVPQASRGWRNMSGPETKMESKDYESEEEEEESRNPRHGKRDELKTVNNRGGAKLLENKDGYEKPKGNAAAKEFNATAYTEASRPTKTVPLGSTRLPTGSNMPGRETKMESKDYESEEEDEESRHPRYGKRDELKMVNNPGGAKPIENKDGYEKPKGNGAAVQFGQTRFPAPLMQKKEQNTYPEKIDSREARKRYGKSSSQAMGKEGYEGTIDSREAMKKYNGALVP